jgi:hypothetical protein
MVMDFAKRVFGAMRMDAATYEAIEADPGALRQAVLVVLGFGAAAGIGLTASRPTAGSVAIAAAGALAGWLSWAALVYQLGVRVFPEPRTQSSVAEVARTIGFSAAPGLLLVLLAVPVGRPAIFALVAIWMLAAMVVAVRQALDFTHLSRAIAVCLAGWIVTAVLALALGFALGPLVS